MKREGQIGVPIDPGEVSNVFMLQLPISTEIKSASFQSENGDYLLLIHYIADEDNFHAKFKEFKFKTTRYSSSEDICSKDSKSIHLCSIPEGLYTYGVFYAP